MKKNDFEAHGRFSYGRCSMADPKYRCHAAGHTRTNFAIPRAAITIGFANQYELPDFVLSSSVCAVASRICSVTSEAARIGIAPFLVHLMD